MNQKQLIIAGVIFLGILIYLGVLIQFIVLSALVVVLLNMVYPNKVKEYKESLTTMITKED